MAERANIRGRLITWATERSGLAEAKLIERFPKYTEWVGEETKPTLRQLEDFANVTRTPLGYLFLLEPPIEELPIPYFRTLDDHPVERPSPDLLETVQIMQRRQDWMRDYLIEEKENALPFVGSVNINADIKTVAHNIRMTLKFETDWARQYTTWKDASVALREAIDAIGILVTKNGIVGNNTHRKLDIKEFRGFVLTDPYAPLIFINGADYEAAQLFTVAHELAHIWLGFGSSFNLFYLQPFNDEREKFCNKVAAEFLVAESELSNNWDEARQKQNPYKYLAGLFKVSEIVIARRALDLNYINRDQFFEFYNNYKEEQEEFFANRKKDKKQGGNYYNTQNVRLGKKFASAVFYAAKEGKILYRDAFRLTGLTGNTFDKYFERLGFV